MFVKFVIEDPLADILELVIKKLPVVLGRGQHADFQIEDCCVSRQHCRLFLQDNQIHVEDLQSTYGTYLNDESVQKVALQIGDQLTIGLSTFRLDQFDMAGSQPDLDRIASSPS